MEFSNVKIAVYVPVDHADKIREVLNEAGAGQIGNYDFCSFSVKGVGRFRGGEGSEPFVGEAGKIEKVEEERIEVICPKGRLEEVLKSVKEAHPYEEPAIDVYRLMS